MDISKRTEGIIVGKCGTFFACLGEERVTVGSGSGGGSVAVFVVGECGGVGADVVRGGGR